MCIRFITILDSTPVCYTVLYKQDPAFHLLEIMYDFLFLTVINTLDRTINSRRTASPCFLKRFPVLLQNGHSTFIPKSSAGCIKLLFVIEGRVEDDFWCNVSIIFNAEN